MNQLTQLGKQLSELFNSLTPQARIMAGLMLAVIVVSLGWILTTSGGESSVLLLSSPMSPDQLNRAEMALGAAGLGDFQRDGLRLRVPKEQRGAYLQALQDGGAMPTGAGDPIEEALKQGTMFDSPAVRKIRQMHAEEKSLARSLEKYKEIDYANVLFDETNDGFGKPSIKVCSIQLKRVDGSPISSKVRNAILEVAATTFAGLQRENISILDLGTGEILSRNEEANHTENAALSAKADWDRFYENKIREQLSDFGRVHVGVDVIIDPTVESMSEEMSYQPTGVNTQTASTTRNVQTSKPVPGGRPGSYTNAKLSLEPTAVASTAAEQSSSTKESTENISSKYGTTATAKKTLGGMPEQVKVTVRLPDSHFRELYMHQQELSDPAFDRSGVKWADPQIAAALKTLTDSTMTEVKNNLGVFLQGFRQGESRDPLIKVSTYTDLPLEEIPGPSFLETGLVWLQDSWSTLAMLALVGVSLFMMAGWVKQQPSAETVEKQFADGFGLQIPETIGDELDLSSGSDAAGGSGSGGSGEAGEDGEGRSGPALEVTGEEIKEDLSTLIKENPDAAVNLLKTWIGEAA